MSAPDRSVEEIVAEFVQLQNSTDDFKDEAQVNWLRATLTSLYTLGIEAGGDKMNIKHIQDLIAIGERIKNGEVTIEQYLERWRGHLATLKHPNEPV